MTEPDQPDWPDPTDAGWGREPMTVPMTRSQELILDDQWRFHPVDSSEDAHSIPKDNPIGHHQRKFDVDSELLDGQLLITLGVLDCCFHLAINGAVVGYSTDCGRATTFDITAHCHEGSNTIAVRGYRSSATSDAEVSDRHRPGEFHGSVELWSRPLVHLLDVDFRGRSATGQHRLQHHDKGDGRRSRSRLCGLAARRNLIGRRERNRTGLRPRTGRGRGHNRAALRLRGHPDLVSGGPLPTSASSRPLDE